MKFIKVQTSEGETRWINLDLVSRVTLATESGRAQPLMVITFADACPEARVQIRGGNEVDDKAIRQLTKALDKFKD